MTTVRDRLWAWGHVAGTHDHYVGRSIPATPLDGARHLGIPNLFMVVYGNRPAPEEFEAHQTTFAPLRRVVWSIMGDSSSTRNDARSDLDAVLALAGRHANVAGGIMDDLFLAPGQAGDGDRVARWSAEEIRAARERLNGAVRRLDLYAVFYDQLLVPGNARYRDLLRRHLECCDKATFWTWRAENLSRLDENFAQFEELTAPGGVGRLLGCYMWDYGGNSQPMPLDLMEQQCLTGLRWLKQGRIEGMIFLATNICDAGLPAVEWTREWIARVGGESLGRE